MTHVFEVLIATNPPKESIINVMAKHFKDITYIDPCYCPIANAVKDEFNIDDVVETVTCITVGGLLYHHQQYDQAMYRKDFSAAYAANFDDTVIRQIKITRL